TFDDRDERAQAGDPACPLPLVMDDGRPSVKLLGRVEATRELVDRRHENTSQLRFFAWNEIADNHALANALFDHLRVTRPHTQLSLQKAMFVIRPRISSGPRTKPPLNAFGPVTSAVMRASAAPMSRALNA